MQNQNQINNLDFEKSEGCISFTIMLVYFYFSVNNFLDRISAQIFTIIYIMYTIHIKSMSNLLMENVSRMVLKTCIGAF